MEFLLDGVLFLLLEKLLGNLVIINGDGLGLRG